jgi:protein-S-isoprenylcysteine O-methyltransferase Ste14
MKDIPRNYRATAVNVLLFALLGYGSVYRAYYAWIAEKFDLVEAVFFTHNLILVVVILMRTMHVSINKNTFHQAVALIAFFSGMAFDERPTAQNPFLLGSSQVVTVTALIMGLGALFSLGRSFGILIAVRRVKTGGLYSIVRHPMYLTDILWRLGFVLHNPSAYNLALFIGSSSAYVYRALLEERFLVQFPDYREYMQRVKHRFIPGVF